MEEDAIRIRRGVGVCEGGGELWARGGVCFELCVL